MKMWGNRAKTDSTVYGREMRESDPDLTSVATPNTSPHGHLHLTPLCSDSHSLPGRARCAAVRHTVRIVQPGRITHTHTHTAHSTSLSPRPAVTQHRLAAPPRSWDSTSGLCTREPTRTSSSATTMRSGKLPRWSRLLVASVLARSRMTSARKRLCSVVHASHAL